MTEITFRVTEQEDVFALQDWLADPAILRWFPMCDAKEIEDAAKLWVSYGKIGAALTALFQGEPCAMATLYIQPYVKQRHTCLFSIIVREDMRGKGVGRLFIQELERVAKEKFQIEILHLEVYEGNPAERLYRKMGFTFFGRQALFIKEHEQYNAKILMQKSL
ncbi:MAG: hypothetical protein RLZZ453_664 [Chlamydiota bacterium]|jgi:putative acetyltransferase